MEKISVEFPVLIAVYCKNISIEVLAPLPGQSFEKQHKTKSEMVGVPDRRAVEEKVIAAVAKVAKRPTIEIRGESNFGELGMDSFDRVCLLFELEQAFDISIPEQAVQGIQTVQDIVTQLREHLSAPPENPAPAIPPS